MQTDKHDRINAKKRWGLKFDPKYKYCINSEIIDNDLDLQRRMKEAGYRLRYYDGCFYPFLVKAAK